MYPFPSYSEDYVIEEIEDGYRVSKTCGSGMPVGALNNYQIDLNFTQAGNMFRKMMNVFNSLDCNQDIGATKDRDSYWYITIEFADGVIKKAEGHDICCKSIEPIIKILKATIRWIL